MKTPFTLSAIIALALLFFASCTTVSVTKRQYRSGYHIEWGSGKPHRATSMHNEFHKEIETVKNEEFQMPESAPAELLASAEDSDEAEAETETETESRAVDSKTKSEKSGIMVVPATAIYSFTGTEKPQHTLIPYAMTKELQDNPRGIGWFLWVLIMILVVLWLLGLLVGGVGNALHILIVVALVLLLLRLISVL